MAAVHFTTIPFEPNTAFNSNIAYPRFEVYKTFPFVFMSNFMVFIRQELWVNVLVAVFLGTVDLETMLMQNFWGG